MANNGLYVDDRDTTYNYFNSPQENIQKWNVILDQLRSGNPGFRIKHIGRGLFKIDLPVLTCTGSDIETLILIPFVHEFVKQESKHTDSSKNDSTNKLSYSISHRVNPNLWILILNIIDTEVSDIIDEYSQFFHDECQYLLLSNSTNTDLLYISFYIRYMGD